jgi:hypothetical protein
VWVAVAVCAAAATTAATSVGFGCASLMMRMMHTGTTQHNTTQHNTTQHNTTQHRQSTCAYVSLIVWQLPMLGSRDQQARISSSFCFPNKRVSGWCRSALLQVPSSCSFRQLSTGNCQQADKEAGKERINSRSLFLVPSPNQANQATTVSLRGCVDGVLMQLCCCSNLRLLVSVHQAIATLS